MSSHDIRVRDIGTSLGDVNKVYVCNPNSTNEETKVYQAQCSTAAK